jgi:hypothetical protein
MQVGRPLTGVADDARRVVGVLGDGPQPGERAQQRRAYGIGRLRVEVALQLVEYGLRIPGHLIRPAVVDEPAYAERIADARRQRRLLRTGAAGGGPYLEQPLRRGSPGRELAYEIPQRLGVQGVEPRVDMVDRRRWRGRQVAVERGQAERDQMFAKPPLGEVRAGARGGQLAT